MRLQDFATLTGQDLDALDTPTLRRLVSAQAGTLNRRLQNIRYNPDASQIAVKSVMSSGGRFGTRSHTRKTAHGARQPMTRKELLYEAKREIKFARHQGSTVSSAKKLKETNQRIGGGQTAKEYAKERQKQAREEVRKQIYAENRAAGRRANKYTEAQKYAMKQAGKQAYTQAKKAYDKAVTDYWNTYHDYKEKENVIGSPPTIAENVSKVAFMSEEEQKKHFANIVKDYEEQMLQNGGEVPEDFNPLKLVDNTEDDEDEEGWSKEFR